MTARHLIVNADDFGLSPGVNEGILEAHVNGIVTSTSLMVDASAAQLGATQAREHPRLSVGLHFVEERGSDLDDRAQAASSFERQLARFRELTGADPTHVDSHHHVHTEDDRMATFAELVAPLGVPLRGDGRVAYIGGFWAQWEPGVTNLAYVSRQFLLELVRTEAVERFTELACHPARITGDFASDYLDEREVELRTLTGKRLRDEVEANGVELVSYHDWAADLAPEPAGKPRRNEA